jgi:hypothetical protein
MDVHRHEVDHRLEGGYAREQHVQEVSPVVIGGGGTKARPYLTIRFNGGLN